MLTFDEDYWRDRIDDILDNLDFQNIHLTMKALDWQWHSLRAVPVEYELRTAVRSELKRLCFSKDYSNIAVLSTGGFRYEIDKKEGTLRTAFIVTEWDSYVE